MRVRTEARINVIDIRDYNFSPAMCDILFAMHSHGYDDCPDCGYSVFIASSSLQNILEDYLTDEVDGVQEWFDANIHLPYAWTMIVNGNDSPWE